MDFVILIEILFVILYFIGVVISVLPSERSNNTRASNLEKFIQTHKLKTYLKNKYVECRLIKRGKSLEIYCKEKYSLVYDTKTNGALLYVSPYFNDEYAIQLITTFWAMIQQSFRKTTKLRDINILRRDMTFEMQGTVLFDLSYDKLYTYPYMLNEVQNEICRLVFDKEKSTITCTEIWEDNPRSFIIKDSNQNLQQIIQKFRNRSNKFETLDELKEIFKDLIPAEVEKIDINNAELDEIKKLPGINVITAKRIIKKREEIGGFKFIEDVVLFTGVNSHMAENLRKRIEIKPMKISKSKIKHAERNVDI